MQLAKDVNCPGAWVLLSAIGRTEAGEFHALGGKPVQTSVSEYPWLIRVVEAQQQETQAKKPVENKIDLQDSVMAQLKNALSFSYGHNAATLAPSKMTATQRKGRFKDREAAEHAEEKHSVGHSWRSPSFVSMQVEGKTYGTAIHAVMQYISYEACRDVNTVDEQIRKLAEGGYITAQTAELADRRQIAAFFDTDIGQKLQKGTEHVREFKFSILDDAENYGDDLAGEQVLLQGVVDCAMIEADGITILDFKTDYVTEQTLPELTDRYRMQVQTYAQAMSRIYQKPIKAAYLYFFRLNRFVPV